MEERTEYEARPTKEEMAKLIADLCDQHGYGLQASMGFKQQIDSSFTIAPTIILVDLRKSK